MRIFVVQHKKAEFLVPLKAASDTLVGFVTEDIKKKLDLSAPLGSIELRLAAQNKDGVAELVPLDSTATIAEALAKASAVLGRDFAPAEKMRIVAVESVERPPAAEPIARAFLFSKAHHRDRGARRCSILPRM